MPLWAAAFSMLTNKMHIYVQVLNILSEERRFVMADELITAGEAAERLNVTTDIPANKCITKAEFDELLEASIKYTLTVVPTPSDATVKLNGIVTTSIEVSKNTSVSIEVSKTGYKTKTQQVTVTKDTTIRIELEAEVPEGAYTPVNAPVGVYIMSVDGYVYPRSVWKTSDNSKAVGVGVKTDKCAFVIAPEEQTSIQWGGYGTLISGCTTTTDIDVAQTDYKGKENTDAIIATLGVYAAMLSVININDYVSSATTEAESLPSTHENDPSIISDEDYKSLIQKQESGRTLTFDEVQQINDYRNFQIKKAFMEKYEIPSNEVCDIVCDKIRSQFKSLVKMQSEISILPAVETGSSIPPITESDVNNMSDEGIMTLATTSSEQYAANYCRNYTFRNGKVGYQPALGELHEAYQNKAEVDACMSLIGGKALYDSSINNYWKWSSTQFSANYAWILAWDDGNLNHNFSKANSYYTNCARPFSAFQ